MSAKRALWLLIGVNIIWGSTYVVAKAALTTLPPTLLVSLRFLVATVLLWAVVLWRARHRPASEPDPLAIPAGDRLRAIGVGLGGFALGYLLSYLGINLTTATEASLMIIGEVIFTTVLAAIFVGERIGRWRGLGIALGLIGVATLVLSNLPTVTGAPDGWWRALGNLLVLCGIFCEAIYTVAGGALTRRMPPLTMIAYAYMGSLLLWVPITLWHLASGSFPPITLAAGLGVLYLAIFPSVVCILIWFTVIRNTGASLGALSLLVQPVVGATLGILFGDPITLGLIMGGGLIFVALYLTTLPDRPPATAVVRKEVTT